MSHHLQNPFLLLKSNSSHSNNSMIFNECSLSLLGYFLGTPISWNTIRAKQIFTSPRNLHFQIRIYSLIFPTKFTVITKYQDKYQENSFGSIREKNGLKHWWFMLHQKIINIATRLKITILSIVHIPWRVHTKRRNEEDNDEQLTSVKLYWFTQSLST